MTEAKRRKVEAEEERVGRVWGSGAWGDILPTVFHLLPPRDRFFGQRVSRLFQGTSEPARLAVGQLELNDIYLRGNDPKDFKFTAKILDPNASDGITSLRLPNENSKFSWHENMFVSERKSRLKKSQRKCEEALAKLSLPKLRHVSISTGPLTQSHLPFLRSHPSISSLELMVEDTNWGTWKLLKEVEMIAEGLSQAKIRDLSLCVVNIGMNWGFKEVLKDWRTNLFDHVEVLRLYGVELCNLDFLSNPSKLTSLHCESSQFYRIMNASFLDQVPGLRCLSLTFWLNFDIDFAKHLRRFPLESLQIGFHLSSSKTGDVRAVVEDLASGGETSNLAMSLQELTVRISQKFESVDMRVLDTEAFLRFPHLHSLRLQMETTEGHQQTLAEKNALSALPVFNELKRRLRVLEITYFSPGPF